MKVYISTFHNTKNYGAALQSYSLQKTIESLGHESVLIKVRPKKTKKKKMTIKQKVSRFLGVVYNFCYKKQINCADQCFDDFFDKLHNTTEEYSGYEEIFKNPPDGDIYLSGSDQVFNPICMEPIFFLQFGNKAVKRVSYAASMGTNDIPKENVQAFKKYIESFDMISIRESCSKNIIEKYTDKEVNVNVDPCFLLDKDYWEEIADDRLVNRVKRPYILLYVIYKPKWLNDVIKEIKRETKLDVVLVSYDGFKTILRDKTVLDAGPKEFLGLVKNAEMVISSSFHGCVFATIFKKPFYAVVNPNSPERITSMLSLFDLESRILTPETELDFNVDYKNMDRILPIEQQKSKDYLISAIEEA